MECKSWDESNLVRRAMRRIWVHSRTVQGNKKKDRGSSMTGNVKTLEELQVMHSELCARAGDMGVAVSEDLTVDFDTVEHGTEVCEQLKTLLADAGVAVDSEQEHTATAPKKVGKKKTKAKPAAEAANQESEMANTAKKVKKAAPKKGAAAKGKKAPAKKTAKKAGSKKAKGGVRADTKVSKVIAKLKNGGITRAEVLKMTGWKAVSMQQLAKSAGVKLKVSEERPFTYRAA